MTQVVPALNNRVMAKRTLSVSPNMQLKLLLILALGLCIPATVEAGTLSIISETRWVNATTIIDGDTFHTDKGEKVRLLGINTPETMHDDEPGQPLGQTAKKRLRSLIEGKTVQLEFDRDKRDDYGRLLAQVYLRGQWINGILVEEGLAHVYTFAPNFKWAAALLEKEKKARARKAGIWATSRFAVLQSTRLKQTHIGQFRVVTGRISKPERWQFRMGRIHVSIPRKYRAYFRHAPELKAGETVVVRGKIRVSRQGEYFLAIHTPFDLEVSP